MKVLKFIEKNNNQYLIINKGASIAKLQKISNDISQSSQIVEVLGCDSLDFKFGFDGEWGSVECIVYTDEIETTGTILAFGPTTNFEVHGCIVLENDNLTPGEGKTKLLQDAIIDVLRTNY